MHGQNDVQAKSFAELAEVLKNASMEDKTVIVTSINQAYAAPGSLLDLFLESWRGVVCRLSFHICRGTNCYFM